MRNKQQGGNISFGHCYLLSKSSEEQWECQGLVCSWLPLKHLSSLPLFLIRAPSWVFLLGPQGRLRAAINQRPHRKALISTLREGTTLRADHERLAGTWGLPGLEEERPTSKWSATEPSLPPRLSRTRTWRCYWKASCAQIALAG